MNPKIMPSFFDEPPLQCHEMLLWLDPLRLFAASFWVPAIYFLRLPFFFDAGEEQKPKSGNKHQNTAAVGELNVLKMLLGQGANR